MFASLNRGWEVVGIRDGFNGMLLPENYPRGGVTRLDRGSVRGISHLGGTILGLSNKGTPTRTSGAAAWLFATATSRGRVIVVEVMGRYAGWIALHAGMVPGAHCILIPEIPYELELVAAAVEKREERGAQFSIVVVAEGAVPLGGVGLGEGKVDRSSRATRGVGQAVAAGL
jgi:6-phosphofructokinase